MNQEHISTIIKKVFSDGNWLIEGKRYHSKLPEALEAWYVYTRDGGHNICIVPRSLIAKLNIKEKEDINVLWGYMVPAPVKSVIKKGYSIKPNGVIVCDLEYDSQYGLVTNDEDEF